MIFARPGIFACLVLMALPWAGCPAGAAPVTDNALTELVKQVTRDIPRSLTAQMVWLTARAEMWQTALREALPACPVSGSAGLALRDDQRLPLLAQLYQAHADPLTDVAKQATAPGTADLELHMRPRPNTAALAAVLVQNPEVLALQQRLFDDTDTVLARIRRNWNGAESLESVWSSADWKRETNILQGLWLTQQALALTPEGWLTTPDTLAALDLACRLAPDCAVAHLLLAEARVQRNLPQQAIDAASQALRLWPELGRARYARAFAHWRLHQLALAEDDFTVALHPQQAVPLQGPELARRLRARGAVRLVQQKTDAMCEDFARACALGDCDGLAHAREQGLCRKEQ